MRKIANSSNREEWILMN